jgi:hypothetical protein
VLWLSLQIDAGNKKDKDRYQRENINIGNIAIFCFRLGSNAGTHRAVTPKKRGIHLVLFHFITVAPLQKARNFASNFFGFTPAFNSK